jgi:uncharacterized membrane protein YhaH (DUF805 family)
LRRVPPSPCAHPEGRNPPFAETQIETLPDPNQAWTEFPPARAGQRGQDALRLTGAEMKDARMRRPRRVKLERGKSMNLPSIDPLIAGGVVLTTALTDAIYVQFTAAVADRRRFAAASWSSAWYLLAAFAIISYTSNWVYVLFAALGSWIGGFVSITALSRAAQSRAGEGRGSPHGQGPT